MAKQVIYGVRIGKGSKKALSKNGFYVYDLRTWDIGNGCTIENFVLVNHEGTMVTDVPIEVPVYDCYNYLSQNNFEEFSKDEQNRINVLIDEGQSIY